MPLSAAAVRDDSAAVWNDSAVVGTDAGVVLGVERQFGVAFRRTRPFVRRSATGPFISDGSLSSHVARPVAGTAVEVVVVALVVFALLYQPPDPVHRVSVERVDDADAVHGPVSEFSALPERRQAGVREALGDRYDTATAREEPMDSIRYGVRYEGALYRVDSHPVYWDVADSYYDPTPWGVYAAIFAGGLLATRSVARGRGWY